MAHPDAATVHELYCPELELCGMCEHYVPEGLEGGPYLMVRVAPGKPLVLVALKHIERVIPQRDAAGVRR